MALQQMHKNPKAVLFLAGLQLRLQYLKRIKTLTPALG